MRFKLILVLLLIMLSSFSIFGEQERVKEFTIMTDDPVVCSEHVILLYIPDPLKYGDGIEIFPTGIMLCHPDYLEPMNEVLLRVFPTGLIKRGMVFLHTCYWGMGEEGYPFPEESDDIITYPNSANEKITFSNLPENSELNIFTISGERVFTVRLENENEYTWYLQNESGKNVSSGVYVYTVISENFRKKDKITIIK